ncbi:MAG: hypothetical protein HYT07_03560 [Candidatus Levybacteria bacterium]|nr:hypothetical protein [Candidatus Levybacteria bacterium]
MEKIAFSIPGFPNIDIGLPTGVPTGGLFPRGQNIIAVVIEFLILAALIFSVYSIFLAGFNMMTSGGDKERFAHGRERLRYAIIGLLVIFFTIFILSLLGGFFGIKLLGSN